jgi:choice-of-anchor B domain-containing protein
MYPRFPIFLFLVIHLSIRSQTPTYDTKNIELLSVVNPYADSIVHPHYSGCWGWYQVEKQREYAILGGGKGTFFYDVTNPAAPVLCDYAHGAVSRREIKTYGKYAYLINVNSFSGFQIADMSYLPDSVHIVYNGTDIFRQAHTLWIDGNKMYCSGVSVTGGTGSGLSVYSLANPEKPQLLRSVNSDFNFISAHDVFARRDTIFVSDPAKGLWVLYYDSVFNKFNMLGSYSDYDKQGYNHSGYLTANGKYFVFCDEVPDGVPVHLVDVSNLSNIQAVSQFLPYPLTVPHNPFIVGNDWAIISCYEDGLHIYDIRDPYNVIHSGYFDTHPQAGHGQPTSGAFMGNWGAYPFLPSRNIIAADMQNGLFMLDAKVTYSTATESGETPDKQKEECPQILTNPTSVCIQVNLYEKNETRVSLSTPEGKSVFENVVAGNSSQKINTAFLANGFYILSVDGKTCKVTKKIIVAHR